MDKRIKFSVGNVQRGYKSVEISVDDTTVEYKILRNEFKLIEVASVVVDIVDNWAEYLDDLNIFAWEKDYRGEENPDGEQWTLTFQDGDKIYRGRGSNAYPDNWDEFLDALDVLIPEMEFIDSERLESVELRLSHEDDILEELTLSREEKVLTIDKQSARHEYRLSVEDTKKFLDICQKYFESLEADDDAEYGLDLSVTLYRHDDSEESLTMAYNEYSMPGVVKFAEEIHAFIPDLSAQIFSPEAAQVTNDNARIILCKVQFKGNYKSYTYRAEDETLAVGDIVDVPVGRNNDVTQAKIVDIGYFDEDEISIPLDKIKTIIGKHTGNAWDTF